MDFVHRIQVTCFAGSYAVAIVHELVRILWPQPWVRRVSTTAFLVGLAAHTLYLFSLGMDHHRLPITTQFESLVAVSWLISLIGLYLLIRDRQTAAGLFVLPVSLGVILFAAALAERGFRRPDEQHAIIAGAHGLLLLLGVMLAAVALIAALMYLIKVWQLKTGATTASVRLPSLERLDRTNTLAVYFAWPVLTVGIGLGFYLQSLPASDPKVVSTSLAWCLFTVLAHCRYRPENRGRKVALMTIVACVVVLVSMLGDPIFGTSHQAGGGG